jgi:hypothetical protein
MKALIGIAIFLLVVAQPTEAGVKKFKEKDLVGVWDYVAAFQRSPDGTITYQFGNSPSGRFVIAKGGAYLHWVQRPDLPRITSGLIANMTDAEAHAVAEGVLGHFGKWSADEHAGTFTVHIEKSSFANFNGINQVRRITKLTRKDLEYENTTTTGGSGVVVVAKLRRAE